MFVLTIDQRGSRRSADEVPALLESLPPTASAALPIVRTVGDEIQGAIEDPVDVVSLVLHVVRRGGWSIGLGVGEAALGATTPESTGPAFIRAREAVERAKGRTVPVPFAIEADPSRATPAGDAEAIAHLLLAVVADRSPAQWRVVDQLSAGRTGKEAAESLGISPQGVSKMRGEALYDTEIAVRPALARLLSLLD